MSIGVDRFAVISLALPLVLFSGATWAEQAAVQKIGTGYDVYVGEVRFLHAEAQTLFDAQQYRFTAQAQTVGAWATLLPWAATAASNGKMIDGRAAPKHYTTTISWRQQPKTVALDYAANGDVTYVKESGAVPKQVEALPRAVTDKTLDPLSGVLQMLTQVSGQESCQTAATVFDGKQRVDVKVKDQGVVKLQANDKNTYGGVARQCLLTFKRDVKKQIVGQTNANDKLAFWQGAGERPPVTVWLAHLRPELPLVPVRAETTCPLGVVTAQLASWSNVGQPPASELFARIEAQPR
jgi:hypothetical protein